MKKILFSSTLMILLGICGLAQTNEFTFQGSLKDGANPANANYDFEFRLFAADTGGTALGTLQRLAVPVSGGTFSVKLDFGAQFAGAARFLEIAVKPAGGGGFTTLAPRQPVSSTPYSVRSLNAANADSATTATTAASSTNALQLGGVAANQYVVTTDPRMTDARPPLAGSTDYIQNRSTQQALSNFNVSGTGAANILDAATQFNIFGSRILANPGTGNLFAGIQTGASNTTGQANTFVGANAGRLNVIGSANSYFGASAGENSTGTANSFFGSMAGRDNSGVNNSFFGLASGRSNTGSNNAFFGYQTGLGNTNGQGNAFFGAFAGVANTTGLFNSFVGSGSGQVNTVGANNSFFGSSAGIANLNGSSNSFIGANAGGGNTSGALNVFVGRSSGPLNTLGNNNVFVGASAGFNNTTGSNNTLLGYSAELGAGDLTYATAVGSGATVSTVNTIALGRSSGQDSVVIPGSLSVTGAINGTISNATNAVTATNSLNLGGISAIQFVQTNDSRLTDARSPLPGSSDYIQNTTSTQTSSNFNVSGNGDVGNNLRVGNSLLVGNSGQFATSLSANSLNVATNLTAGNINVANISAQSILASGNLSVTGNSGFSGQLAVANGSAASPSVTFSSDSDTGVFRSSPDTLNFSTGGISRMLIDQNGRIMIGPTSQSSARMQVGVFGGADPAIRAENSTFGEVSGIGIEGSSVNNPGFGIGGLFFGGRSGVAAEAKAQAYTGFAYGVNSLATGSAGVRVGVLGQSLATSGNSASGIGVWGRAEGATVTYGVYGEAVGPGTNWAGYFAGNTYVGGMTAIGTVLPESKLHVNGTTEILSTGTGGGFKFRDRGSASSNDDWVWYSQGNIARFWRFGLGDVIGISASGNVGIGNINPADKLNVNGNVSLLLGSGGSTNVCHSPTTFRLTTCSSSIRYKDNISKYFNGVELIRRLQPVSFNWKEGAMRDFGLVAEEVAKVEPLLVTRNDKGEIEGVKYDRVGVLAINAIKEQQAQIEQQQRQIEALTRIVCSLKPETEICKE